MRLARIALILSAILVGAPLAHAQVAHSNVGCDSCQSGCQSGCQPGCGCSSCSGCGVLTGKLGNCLGGLLGFGTGVDGRHQIYKAALCRNSFDKKFQLPIAYYRHILPFYRHDRCCTSGQCPTCGPHESVVSEGVIGEEEMMEVPVEAQPAPPPEPTPSALHSRAIVPGAIVPGAVVPARSTRQDRVASAPAVRHSGPVVRQVSATESAPPTRRAANPLR